LLQHLALLQDLALLRLVLSNGSLKPAGAAAHSARKSARKPAAARHGAGRTSSRHRAAAGPLAQKKKSPVLGNGYGGFEYHHIARGKTGQVT